MLRYLRLQEQKQQVETRVKTLDTEMQRLKMCIRDRPHVVFCVVCPLHNDLCGSTAVHRVVHFILNGCKEVFGRFAVYRVIYGSSINIRNFLARKIPG